MNEHVDALLEISRLQREAVARFAERLARQQIGELFTEEQHDDTTASHKRR